MLLVALERVNQRVKPCAANLHSCVRACVVCLIVSYAGVLHADVFTPANVNELRDAFEKAGFNRQGDVIDLQGQEFELQQGFELAPDDGHGLILRNGSLTRQTDAVPFRLLNLQSVPYNNVKESSVLIENMEFRNGQLREEEYSVNEGGGGALLTDRLTIIKNSRFINNQVVGFTTGGAIRHSAELELTNVMFMNNKALSTADFQTSQGGAIGIDDGGSLFASHAYFLGNSADEGGAIHAAHGAKYLNITRSAFDGNNARKLGGAIWSSVGEGAVRLSNSSFIANRAPEGGAAIYTQSLFVDIALVHLTLWGNVSDDGNGGGIRAMLPRNGSNITLKNSIVTNNVGGNCSSTKGELIEFESSQYNLLDDETCGASSGAISEAIGSVFSGKFDLYGGITPSLPIASDGPAHHLVPRANCLDYDARDIPRLDNGPQLDQFCDAGAFEIVPIEYIDGDGDSVRNRDDNCASESNPLQSDIDEDGIGDECDARDDRDSDSDTVLNFIDNCPSVPNLLQLDLNANGIGDACDQRADNVVRAPLAR